MLCDVQLKLEISCSFLSSVTCGNKFRMFVDLVLSRELDLPFILVNLLGERFGAIGRSKDDDILLGPKLSIIKKKRKRRMVSCGVVQVSIALGSLVWEIFSDAYPSNHLPIGYYF